MKWRFYLEHKIKPVKLNTLYHCCFKNGADVYQVEYSLTTGAIGNETTSEGHLWLVVSVEGEENIKFHLSKSRTILKQPKEIIEVIVQREAGRFLQQLWATAPPNA